MAPEEPSRAPPPLIARIRAHAPWLLEPGLGTCAVGSTARGEACRRAGLPDDAGAGDLDLAWTLAPEAGEALLREHGVFVATTDASRARGTLGLELDGERVEITSFRGDAPADAPLRARIVADLGRRDMTVGAIAWWLAEDEILDPHGGVDDWQNGLVRAVGEPAARVREHPVRWLRYYRKAHAWGFELEPRIRKLDLAPAVLDAVPPEAIAAELRAALDELASPGVLLLELHEAGVLAQCAPELAPQFDGRPAGPVRHHPEVSQALHLILALEWIVARTAHLPAPDRHAARFAVLCHDLGKNLTDPARFPSHHGHEHAGIELVRSLCRRLPGLADARARNLACDVCALHLVVRRLRELRPGTIARLYDEHFRRASFRADLFALAVAADVAGRRDRAHEGDATARRIEEDVEWVRARCEAVDAAALRAVHAEDLGGFRRALHEARAKSLANRT